MLNEDSLILSGHHLARCDYSKYHEMLYALRHFSDGITTEELKRKYYEKDKFIDKILRRARVIGHVEIESGNNCKITNEGIGYSDLWFALQDRFDIRDIVPSLFDKYDVPINENNIEILMFNVFSEKLDRKSCVKNPRRDSITKYIDAFRYLKRYKDGVVRSKLRNKPSYDGIYIKEFIELALLKGHIKYNEEKKSSMRNPYIKASSEGLCLLTVFDWLVMSCDLGDFVPTKVNF